MDQIFKYIIKDSQKGRLIGLLADADISIAEMADALGISIPTATKLVAELVGQGVIEDLGKAETAGGRRPNLFGLADNGIRFLGVDGSRRMTINIKGHNVPINRGGRPADQTKIVAVVATSAQESPETMVVTPAHALCYLEWRAEKNAVKDLLYIDMSRALSAGVVAGGRLYLGHSGLAGTFNMSPLVEDDIDTLVSGALNDEDKAVEKIENIAEWAGREIAAAVAMLNPELVVIGGSLARAQDYLMLPLQAAVHRFLSKKTYRATRFRLASTEGTAALGAAMIARNKALGLL